MELACTHSRFTATRLRHGVGDFSWTEPAARAVDALLGDSELQDISQPLVSQYLGHLQGYGGAKRSAKELAIASIERILQIYARACGIGTK